MNLLKGSSNLCLGLIGLRGRCSVRSHLQFDYKFFSVSQCTRNGNDDFFLGKGHYLAENTHYESWERRESIGFSDITEMKEVIENKKLSINEYEWMAKAGDALYQKYIQAQGSEKIMVFTEKKIISLIKKGLEPDIIFACSEIFDDDFDDLLLPYTILPLSKDNPEFKQGKNLIAFFKYEVLNKAAQKVKPKIPITILCDYAHNGFSQSCIYDFAAKIGCEEFIFNAEIPPIKLSPTLCNIDISSMKTTFTRDMRNLFSNVLPEQKVLLLLYGSQKMFNQEIIEIPNKLILNEDCAWDKGKIMLVATKNFHLVNVIKNYLPKEIDLFLLNVPYARNWRFKDKTIATLFELLREYLALKKEPSKKKRKESE